MTNVTTSKNKASWTAAVKKAGATAFSSSIGFKGEGGDRIHAFIPGGRTVGYWWPKKKRGEVYHLKSESK